MRSELVAAHGERIMAVVINKAIEWKELTMRAKWLWTSWIYTGLALVIVLEVMFITCTMLFIVPKFKQLVRDGLLDLEVQNELVSWMIAFLNNLSSMTGSYTTLLVVLAVLAWGLFEWRVRGENKSFMRMSALGTAAVGLMLVVWLTAASLLILFCLGVPATGKLARSFALDRVSQLDSSVKALEQTLGNENWDAVQRHSAQAAEALSELTIPASALPALATRNGLPTVEELRAHAKRAAEVLSKVQQASGAHNAPKLEASVRELRTSIDPLLNAAKNRP